MVLPFSPSIIISSIKWGQTILLCVYVCFFNHLLTFGSYLNQKKCTKRVLIKFEILERKPSPRMWHVRFSSIFMMCFILFHLKPTCLHFLSFFLCIFIHSFLIFNPISVLLAFCFQDFLFIHYSYFIPISVYHFPFFFSITSCHPSL